MKLKLLGMLLLLCFTMTGYAAKPALRCINSYVEQNMANCATLAEQGNAQAQHTLGNLYYQEALNHRGYHTKARILFEKAAAQGLAAAQYSLGAMYRDEFNNFPVALQWFEKAAAQGNADAQNSIGYIYENAMGGDAPRLYVFDDKGKNIEPGLEAHIAKFSTKMFEWAMPSETFPRSIYPISEFGQGIEPDLNKAHEWYLKAAQQGHALAQTNLAYLYLMGLGVDKDEQQACQWYQKAAKQAFVPAMNTLGFLYIQGLGCQQDVPKGFDVLLKSYALQPDSHIEQTLNRLEDKEEYLQYQLKFTPLETKSSYRDRFKINDSSEEDVLYERNQHLKYIYHLNFYKANGIGSTYSPNRKTFDIILGKLVGQNSILKERFMLKEALPSHYGYMRMLSYYYKGEVKDIERAQLWRTYAINMGELDHENYWPGY